MRNLILVALPFHLLVITVAEVNHNYTFGDIISFNRSCGKFTYKHFAVYVGTNNVFGQGDKDIFHRIGKTRDKKDCVFGYLKNETKQEKKNYLDKKLTPLNKTEIIKRIKVMKTTEICGNYNLLTNNCEHLATYVRYGKAFVKQEGTTAGKFLKFSFGKTLREADNAVKSISDEEVHKILDEVDKNLEDEEVTKILNDDEAIKIITELNENSAVEDQCGL